MHKEHNVTTSKEDKENYQKLGMFINGNDLCLSSIFIFCNYTYNSTTMLGFGPRFLYLYSSFNLFCH